MEKKLWNNMENREEHCEWYGKYGRKLSWIVKRHGKHGRKECWTVIRFGNYGRNPSWIVKRYEKYGRQLWNDMENMDQKNVEQW